MRPTEKKHRLYMSIIRCPNSLLYAYICMILCVHFLFHVDEFYHFMCSYILGRFISIMRQGSKQKKRNWTRFRTHYPRCVMRRRTRKTMIEYPLLKQSRHQPITTLRTTRKPAYKDSLFEQNLKSKHNHSHDQTPIARLYFWTRLKGKDHSHRVYVFSV